jgi:hypothetical protein
MIHRALRTVFFAAFAATSLVPNAASHAATIAVGPYTTSTTTPFLVPVVVSDAVDLASFTFDLSYDPTAFQIDTGCDPFSDMSCDVVTGPVTQGTFYTASAIFPPLFVPGFVLLDSMGAQTGQLVGVDGAWQDPGPAPSGDGVLAYVEFLAVDGGSATSPIMVAGSPTTVPTTAVPEPPTVALIFTALALVGRLRKRSAPDAKGDAHPGRPLP